MPYCSASVVGWLKAWGFGVPGWLVSKGTRAAWASSAVALKVVRIVASRGEGESAGWKMAKTSSVSGSGSLLVAV